MTTASPFFTELNRIQSFLQDKNNSLQDRYDLFTDVQDYLPVADYLSDWVITQRSSPVYMENVTECQRGILRADSVLTWIIDGLWEYIPEELMNNTMNLDQIIKYSTHPTKDLEVARIEAIVSEGKGGVGIDW